MAMLAVVLPWVICALALFAMRQISGYGRVVSQLAAQADVDDRRPLYARRRYDSEAVARHWGALDSEALQAERRFLQLDLYFPFVYGAALMVSFICCFAAFASGFLVVVFFGATLVAMFCDFQENILQLGQLQRFVDGGPQRLQPSKVAKASLATGFKLLSFLLAVSTWLGAAILALLS